MVAEPISSSRPWPDSGKTGRQLRSELGGSPDGDPIELDRLIHERLRLGIVTALTVNDCLSFNELKAMLRATDGNLSVHARKLEEAGYIECRKSFHGRLPKTEYRVSPVGKRAFERYLNHMGTLIEAVREI